MKRFIGVDPGVGGGLAAFDVAGNITACRMPPTETDIAVWLGSDNSCLVEAAVEKATGMIPGARGVMGIAKLQYNRGVCMGVLAALRIVVHEVSPVKWQKVFGLSGKKWKSDTEKKNAHKRVAQQLFPSLEITHAIADSLLIAEWLRRTETNSKGGE